MAIFNLRAAIKNYDWGMRGCQSLVALLQKSGNEYFIIEEVQPYAEMWMGTHPSGPSVISSLNTELGKWLLDHPDTLGEAILSKFNKSSGLPFLLKVLSVSKALSIQAHPNKATAEILHKYHPDKYPDDNHKPEMAIALTDFEALCGFRPLAEIKAFFEEIPLLQKIAGESVFEHFSISNDRASFKSLFKAVMTCETTIIEPTLLQIVDFFKSNLFSSVQCSDIKDLFIRTHEQYPGDVGCVCIFFLNYLTLQPGEAIFLAANEPHAYLHGDCIECMACSDNVVRAGLTPKYRDVDTLCETLTYRCTAAEGNKFHAVNDPNDRFRKTFNPPVDEFAVDHIVIESSDSYPLCALQSASILLVVEGNGRFEHENEERFLVPGCILFISSDCQMVITQVSHLVIFRAYCSP